MQYQRTVKEHTLKTTLSYINHLVTTIHKMLPLTAKPCLSSQADITYQAALTSGARTFLLVKNGYAYCSSASSDLMLPLKILYPEINWSQHLGFKLQQDIPTMPGKPTVAVWLR